jgi:hypothetical protein
MQRPKDQTLPRLQHGSEHDNPGEDSSRIAERAGGQVDFPIVAGHYRPLPTVDDHCNLSDYSLVRLYKMILMSIMLCRCLLDSDLRNHIFSR